MHRYADLLKIFRLEILYEFRFLQLGFFFFFFAAAI